MIQRIILAVLMNDGTEHNDVVVTTADRIRYGRTARTHKWPPLTEDGDLFMTFVAWAALTRTGIYAGSWEQFIDETEVVTSQDAEDVDPTRTATPIA